jgi:formyl-CoA transferase
MLDDIEIIEIGQMITVPFAGTMLGDMGAGVTKIERPGEGELIRETGPRMEGLGSHYVTVNRNKCCVTANIKTDRGVSIIKELLKDADVLVENLKPGTLDEVGLSYEDVSEINDDIIYCSVHGFREGSKYEDLPAYGPVIQAMGGAMSVTGEPDGQPLREAVPIGDLAASMYTAQSILFALYDRDVNGKSGHYIEIPMLDAFVSWLAPRAAETFVTGEPYPRKGNRHPAGAPIDLFETEDSEIMLMVGSKYQWVRFCDAIGREDLKDDPRFESNDKRLENEEALYDILDAVFEKKPSEYWLELLREHDIAVAPVYDTLEMWDDDYLAELLVESDGLQMIRNPLLINNDTLPVRKKPKPPGGDNKEVLKQLGFDDDEIERFEEDDVI